MNKRRLISVLGWEERFLLGLEGGINQFAINWIDLLVYEEYKSDTIEQFRGALHLSGASGCDFTQHQIQYVNSTQTWKYFQSWVKSQIEFGEEVWLDITTMPRETIWSLLFFLSQKECIIHYVYWPPETYTGEWLCKQPDKPRLLFKHSGVTDLQKETALVILTGFDEERTAQLVYHYEPTITLLGIQHGNQYENLSRNDLAIHGDRLKGATQINSFTIDVYQPNHGLSILRESVVPLLEEYNVIISSLGPKLSAISVYQLYQELPEVALTYVPTHLYSLDYSKGIKEAVTGTFENRLHQLA